MTEETNMNADLHAALTECRASLARADELSRRIGALAAYTHRRNGMTQIKVVHPDGERAALITKFSGEKNWAIRYGYDGDLKFGRNVWDNDEQPTKKDAFWMIGVHWQLDREWNLR
jgi:hypothetical protein